MSIINEALKKTGEYLKQKSSSPSSGEGPDKKKRVKRTYLLYALIASVGILSSNLALNYLWRQSSPRKDPLPKPAQAGKQSFPQDKPEEAAGLMPAATAEGNKAIPAEDSEEKTNEDFVLSGIFLSGGESYALINNQIVRQNGTIKDAAVKKINKDSVELELNGRKVTLTMRNRQD